ncbi:MAG: hypothetical protein ACI4KM_10510 [Oscillospiraceae bacterium]
MISFCYDNSLEEIDGAMTTFQQNFGRKKSFVLSIAAYSLFIVAAIVAVVANPSQILAYGVVVICIIGILYTFTDKKRRRNKIIEALKDMNPEEYTASFYEDRIEINTIIKPKKKEVGVTIDEEADTENIAPTTSIFRPKTDMLDFLENDDSLLLITDRRQIYCFPKRCLTGQQENMLREYLSEKL